MEIVLISDFSDTDEKVEKLRTLVNKIHKNGYEICLSSHISLPQDIIKKCNYYLYDSRNDLIFDHSIKPYKIFGCEYFSIGYKPIFTIGSHLLPMLRIFCSSLVFLKSLGYKKIHYLEYDTEIINFLEFEDNSKKLEKFDLVAYLCEDFDNSESNLKWIRGSFFSLNIDSWSGESLSYDREKIEEKLRENSLGFDSGFFQEKTTFDLFLKDKKILMKKLENIYISFKENWSDSQSSVTNIENSICFVTENNNFRFFVDNINGDKREKIQMILDDTEIRTYYIEKNTWSLFDIGYYPENKIVLFINDKITKELNLKNEKDLFLIKSFDINYK